MKEILGENSFSVTTHSFAISALSAGGNLMYSADGEVWTFKAAIPAGETTVVVNVPRNLLFKIEGNVDKFIVKY